MFVCFGEKMTPKFDFMQRVKHKRKKYKLAECEERGFAQKLKCFAWISVNKSNS